MSAIAAVALVGSLGLTAYLATPAIRRSGLALWHPTVVWLILHVVFLGVGSFVLALDGRGGPAIWLAGAVVAFGAAVAASDRLARGRRRPSDAGETDPPSRMRWPAIVGLAAVGVLLIMPTLLSSGLPFLVVDITGARTQLAGFALQPLRVAVPAIALALTLSFGGWSTRRRVVVVVAVAALIAGELLLASRYLVAELLAVCLVGLGLAGRQIGARRLVLATVASLLVFGAVQVARAYDQAQGREIAFALERTVARVVMIQPRTLEAIQSAFPDDEPFLAGLGWLRRLGPAFGDPDIPNLGYWIYPRLFPGQQPPGYAAPGLIGEAWANLGPAGLALFALLGVAAERLGVFLSRRRRETADLVAGALLVVFVARTHAVGLNGLAILVALVVGWRILAAGGLDGTWRAVRDVLAWRV